MDKSPSNNCQEVDDGSWDLDENNEDVENLSSNSWDSSSEKEGKVRDDGQETKVELFRKEEQEEVIESLDSWRSSEHKIIKASERPVFLASDSSGSLSEICLPEKSHFDLVEEFAASPRPDPEDEPRVSPKFFDRIDDIECLVVEDLEEPEIAERGNDDDIWKIPLTGRTGSSDDSIILLPSTRTGRLLHTKSKSDSKVGPVAIVVKKSRSCGDLIAQAHHSLKDALIQFEGCQKKVDKKVRDDSLTDIITDLGDRPVHYQEIECRTLQTIITNVKKEPMDVSESDEAKDEPEACSHPYPGTSSKMSEEAASLPDIACAGRSEMKGNHEFRKAVSYTTNHNIKNSCFKSKESNLTESWILLDEMGQSQPVTLTEVNFLLNGRSADAVLQENKEHFISKSTLVRNANSDLRVDQWNPLVEESLQHFLNEEDVVGEESASKSIRLERKFGNMLLYIQSGVNLTSSVRFIPVDTEMIHMWRQSKENVSPISSEDDTHMAMSENITEETSEYDNQETSDDVRGRNVHEMYKPGPVMRKRRTRQSKADDYEHRMVENRRIIESLTDDIKQLRMRLDAERSRSSGLEQEIYRLRGQLDKCRSGQSSADSHKTKSEVTEEYRKVNDNNYIPEITSSSLLSFEEFRQESEAKPKRGDRHNRQHHADHGSTDQKNFKEALDRNLNDIEEILKCKNKAQAPIKGSEKESDCKFADNTSRISSSASVNTCAVLETASQVLSETTGSADSWFKPNSDNAQRNISEVINNLEKENEQLVMENLNLKKKLNEISIELDEYISSCVIGSPIEDGKQAESLRNQVCNLKLELENLKSLAKNKEQSYKLKDAIVREELAEKSVSLEEWRTSILKVFRDMDETKLVEIGFPIPTLSKEVAKLTPNDLFSHLRTIMTQLTAKVVDFHKENSILRRSIQENFACKSKMFNLDQSFDVNYLQEIPGLMFGNLSSEKGNEYRVLLSDKTALEQEVNNLRQENDLLLEYQIDHNEKLKKANLALREEKAKLDSLEKSVKIMEIEKEELSQALVSCQKEKTIAESELDLEKSRTADLRNECEKLKLEMKDLQERLEEAVSLFRDSDQTSTMKDEIINKLKCSYNELESRESLHSGKVQFLTEQLKKLERENAELGEELQSTKQIAEETSKGMSEYISHLESMVNNAEDNLSEMKDKFNETFKSFTALKKAYEELEKQNASNQKMFNKTKDELENCRETMRELEDNNKRNEEAKRKALSELNTIVKSEMDKTETLQQLIEERKKLDEEISALRVKAETQTKIKDKLLKEQKDFINEIAILKKENSKLSQKYRSVKSECNERTKLLRHLDGKLKENFSEYNKRIACLEKNVGNIMEKAMACKDTFIERRSEVDAVVRDLRVQLDAVYMEKRDLESEAANFYSAVKHLQKEVSEKRMDIGDDRMGSSDGSGCNTKADQLENRLKTAEADLADAQEKIRQLEGTKEDDRNKYESIIADLKSQISRYQVRLEVMLKNISMYGKNVQEPTRETEEKITGLEQKVRELTEEVEKKRKRALELTEVIENNEAEIKKKGDECESLKEKVVHLKDEIKSMKDQFSKLQEFLSTVNKNVETYQSERDEVAAKLAKSLKLIVEERASKQSSEAVYAEKEKLFKEQLQQLQERLTEKKRDYEALLKMLDEKKVTVNRLQDDVKRWRSEVAILKTQVAALKDQNGRRESLEGCEDMDKQKSNAELKEVRAMNLELRKKEGTLQATIIRLEDELRGARLLIKELEGDLRTEKTSKKLLKEMITAAKGQIDKFKRGGQIMASIADKIERHFNLSEVQSREMFSGYRAAGELSTLAII